MQEANNKLLPTSTAFDYLVALVGNPLFSAHTVDKKNVDRIIYTEDNL